MQEISNYVSSLVTLIVAMTIIELILPNHNIKKYVMFSCSLVILLNVINPILKVFGLEINISEEINKIQNEMKTYENNSLTNYSLENNIYMSYVENLKNDMKNRLEDIGYEVLDTEIQMNEFTYEPEKIEMRVRYSDGYVQPIIIDVFGEINANEVNEIEIAKIKSVLSEVYGIKKESIEINDI